MLRHTMSQVSRLMSVDILCAFVNRHEEMYCTVPYLSVPLIWRGSLDGQGVIVFYSSGTALSPIDAVVLTIDIDVNVT